MKKISEYFNGLSDFSAMIHIVFFVVALWSFIIGSIEALEDKSCEYNNIASRITVPYIVGCELFRERWE